MASTLGSLVVSLGLNSAQFIAGLTKSEYEAKQFAKNFSNQVAAGVVKAEIALKVLGDTARTALNAFPELIGQAGNFQDLAEKTGASAEALASFAVAAKVADATTEDVAGAMQKLSKNLLGVDDDSKAAGAALKALNIPIEQFKQLKPEDQIETVAKAMAHFQDGTDKVAVAMALFGKSGANLLPFFKELAEGSGRVVILNNQLIKQADDYVDRQKRVSAELNLMAQVVATLASGPLSVFTSTLKEAAAELIGIDKNSKNLRDSGVVEEWAFSAARALGLVISGAEATKSIFELVGESLGAGIAKLQIAATGGDPAVIQQAYEEQWNRIINRQLFSQRLDKQIADFKRDQALRAREDRGFTPDRAKLDFSGAQKKDAGGDKVSEAERLLLSLQKQLETTQNLSVEEKTLRELQSGRVKGLTPELEKQILATARTIDEYKKLEQEIEVMKKRWEEESKAAEKAADIRNKAAADALNEAEKIAEGNDKLRDEIAIILGGENARKALEKQRVADALAMAQQAQAEALLDPLRKQEAANIQLVIDQLKERQGLLEGKGLAENLAKEAAQLQDVKNLFSDTFANAFADFIDGTKSASEAFKSFEKDIVRAISRIAAQNIGNALFGGKNGGGIDIGSILSKFIGGFFGEGSSGGGTPPMFPGNMGADFLTPGFARGGTSMGGEAWVGENGAEKIFLPPGTRVLPNERSMRASGHTFNISVPVMPGATTASAKQQANLIRDAVLRSIKDR